MAHTHAPRKGACTHLREGERRREKAREGERRRGSTHAPRKGALHALQETASGNGEHLYATARPFRDEQEVGRHRDACRVPKVARAVAPTPDLLQRTTAQGEDAQPVVAHVRDPHALVVHDNAARVVQLPRTAAAPSEAEGEGPVLCKARDAMVALVRHVGAAIWTHCHAVRLLEARRLQCIGGCGHSGGGGGLLARIAWPPLCGRRCSCTSCAAVRAPCAATGNALCVAAAAGCMAAAAEGADGTAVPIEDLHAIGCIGDVESAIPQRQAQRSRQPPGILATHFSQGRRGVRRENANGATATVGDGHAAVGKWYCEEGRVERRQMRHVDGRGVLFVAGEGRSVNNVRTLRLWQMRCCCKRARLRRPRAATLTKRLFEISSQSDQASWPFRGRYAVARLRRSTGL